MQVHDAAREREPDAHAPVALGARVPLVALSGFGAAEDRDRALESGFDVSEI